MYKLLAKLIIATALANLGISTVDLIKTAYSNPKAMHELSKKVVSIDWKPVSIFPKEARRFR